MGVKNKHIKTPCSTAVCFFFFFTDPAMPFVDEVGFVRLVKVYSPYGPNFYTAPLSSVCSDSYLPKVFTITLFTTITNTPIKKQIVTLKKV